MAHSRLNRNDQCRYSIDDDGNIRVESTETGQKGFFTAEAVHISGELKQADVQMCQYLASLGRHRQ